MFVRSVEDIWSLIKYQVSVTGSKPPYLMSFCHHVIQSANMFLTHLSDVTLLQPDFVPKDPTSPSAETLSRVIPKRSNGALTWT